MLKSGDRPHILLCGFYFQGNTGDDLFADSISRTISKYGEVKVASIMSFDKDLVDWCDILVIGAGSHITPRGIGGYEHARYAKERGKKVVFYSLTIEEGHPLLDEHLSRADIITVRDPASKKITEAHGFRAVLASDPIFERKKRKIGFSFRRWVNEPEDVEDSLARVLDELARDYDIISVPYTLVDTDTESDLVFHEKIISKMKYKSQHVPYDDAINEINLLIGMRLHALINAVNLDKKVLAINYDAKVGRIFSDLLNNEMVIPYTEIDRIPDIVRERIFRVDHLAMREKVNEALIENMCFDLSGGRKPKVSVVMPTYNRAIFLKDAIDSILSQTFEDWELVLIDDGSTDNTIDVVKSYVDNRIRYYNFGHNGISFSRNIGNLLSRGEIIAVADSDDINMPERLEITLQEMEKNGADIVYASMVYLHRNGSRELLPSYPFSYERLRNGNFLYHPTIAVRRKVAMTCPYNENIEVSEDYDMYLQAAGKGYKFQQIEKPLVLYRLHDGQISYQKENDVKRIHDRLVESSRPLVSVIIPTYNRPNMLKEAIESILAQTYRNFEVIVVNDAGEDVREIIDSLNSDRNIIHIRHEKNKGRSAARNTGLRAANGKYIAYLDDDDVFYPNHLETSVQFLEGNKEYAVVYTDACYAYQTRINDKYVTTDKKVKYSFDFDKRRLLVSNYIPIINVVHRCDILEKTGLFDEAFNAHEDWDLWIRLSCHTNFYHIKEITAEIRIRDDKTNTTTKDRAPFLETLKMIHSRYLPLVTDPQILSDQKYVERHLEREVVLQRVDPDIYKIFEEILKEKDVHIEGLENAVREKDVQIGNLENAVREKNAQIGNLENAVREKNAQIQYIYSGHGWRLLSKYFKLRDKILPAGSRRREVVKIIWRSYNSAIKAIKTVVRSKARDIYELWILKNEPSNEELMRQKQLSKEFKYKPKISIITPVYNTDKRILIETIESVINQTYDNWELCLADGNSQKSYIKEILNRYASRDSRIKAKFLNENKGIAGNSNEALSLATGDFIALLDHDDTLAPFALYEVAKLLNQDRNIDFIYSDEDKISMKGKRFDPHFKPDWSPDMLRSYNYITHFSVIKEKIVKILGGFREGYDGSQDYDLFLRVVENTKRIAHIPKVLYHWRYHKSSAAGNPMAKPYAYESAKKALNDHIQRLGLSGWVYNGQFLNSYRIKYHINGSPLVSIIIPTRDKVEVLKRCINSILYQSSYTNYRIYIVDNQSNEDKTLEYYKGLMEEPKIKILTYDKPFNFSAINNYAVSQVDSEYIIFLNNDTEVISKDWIEAMLEFAQRKDVGTVGSLLYYPDNTLQHAGVIVGLGEVAGHSHKHFPKESLGYMGRAKIIQNLSAVTAACLMTRKEVFNEVGGFDENYSHAFNDVDFCLKLREKGYLIVYTPYAELYHYESISRGYEDTPEKQERFKKEIEYFQKKWEHMLSQGDPYYNPNLTLAMEDFSIRI